MKIGAHISGSGNLKLAFKKAKLLGIDTMQLFSSAPTNWALPQWNELKIEEFKELSKKNKINPIFFHGIYLINLASEKPNFLHLSKEALKADLNLSAQLNIDGVIFHVGSTLKKEFEEKKDEIIKNLIDILEKSNPSSKLILENSAGAGGTVGKKFDQFGSLWKELKKYHNRVKFCFDTCHAFASGYDIRSQEGIKSLKTEIDSSIGLKNIIAMHVNDSKGELGSNRDRHTNIGEGNIGIKGFKLLAEDNFFNSLPWILETPGLDNTGPDKFNVEKLKSL